MLSHDYKHTKPILRLLEVYYIMSIPNFYTFRMKELGIKNTEFIFHPKLLTRYATIPHHININIGDIIQILYNNYRVPEDTIYIWNGSEFDFIYNKWNIVSIYEKGPDYFAQYGYYDLPDLHCIFKEDVHGYVSSNITLAGHNYIVQCRPFSVRDWAINQGYITLSYQYCPRKNMIIAI